MKVHCLTRHPPAARKREREVQGEAQDVVALHRIWLENTAMGSTDLDGSS
jgi:hypothetical protein